MAVKQHIAIRGFHLGGLILFVLILGTADLRAQNSPFDPALSGEAAGIVENVACFTDRSLYITEEPIRFSAMLKGTGLADQGPWSTVLYVELVSAEGKEMARGKYPVSDHLSSGEIVIPAGLLSGTYYLRCYTRWMRNRGPETFSYVPLRIINPLRSELERAVPAAEAGANLPACAGKTALLDFEPHPASYGRGDSVKLRLLFHGERLPDTIRGCLSVVPRSARPADHLWEVETVERDPEGDSAGDFRLSFLPDKYGPSLSGSVVYPDVVDEALPETRIHFTLMGEATDYFVCRPDASGRFTLALPSRNGEMELFVQSESPGTGALEVRIDRDFDQRQLLFPANSFSLSDKERQMATIMARNVQLSRIYLDSDSIRDRTSASKSFPFYGFPTFSLDMDRYVLLPTLEEVFLNLVPSVTPVIRRNRASLKIESENPALSMFDPLLMVDQVPVLDFEKFMAVPPAKIRRIDVIEDVYVKGDLRFGGVINLQSREKDMAGIDLPVNSFFIDYMVMHPPIPVMQDAVSEDDRMPDTRNTLLWSPDFMLVKGSPVRISFILPDYPGEYVVLFRGLGSGGELILAETTFGVIQ